MVVFVRFLLRDACSRRGNDRGIAIVLTTLLPDGKHQHRSIAVYDDEACVQGSVGRLQDDARRWRRRGAQPFESRAGSRTRTAKSTSQEIVDSIAECLTYDWFGHTASMTAAISTPASAAARPFFAAS